MSPEQHALNVPGMLALGALGAIAGAALSFGVRAAGVT
jgi:hypothetical protein